MSSYKEGGKEDTPILKREQKAEKMRSTDQQGRSSHGDQPPCSEVWM